MACDFCVCLILFIFSCPFFFPSWSLTLSRFSFYLTVSLYVLSLRRPWSLSWACKMCKAKCVEKKFLHSNYNEEQWGLKKRLAHNFPEKKRKNIPSSTKFSHSSCQVLLLCVVASNMFGSTKIYLLLNQTCKEKERKSPHHYFSGWRSSNGFGMASLGLGFGWLKSLPIPFVTFAFLPFLEANQMKSDRYRNTRCLTVCRDGC